MLIITQTWLVNGYNLFSSCEQSEKGIKLGGGESSLLVEGLNIKRTRVLQKGIHPLIYSFKEHSRNIFVPNGDTKRTKEESSFQEVYENIDM